MIVFPHGFLATQGEAPSAFSNTYSVDFDGVNDYVDLNNGASVNPSSIISLSCWVKFNSLSNYDGIFGKRMGISVTMPFMLSLDHTSKIRFRIAQSDNTNKNILTNSTVSTGTWYHVVGVADGTNIKLYLDGTLQTDTDTYDGTLKQSTADNVYIGRNANDYLNGNVDDATIFSSVLLASDVTDIYNNGMPKDESSRSNLLGYWKMGDGDYFPTATDSSGNGNDGTIYNETGGEMIQLDTPNGWGTAENETAPEMIQGDTPKGNHGYMDNMDQAAIKQDAPT